MLSLHIDCSARPPRYSNCLWVPAFAGMTFIRSVHN
jgi:hypothetical protein